MHFISNSFLRSSVSATSAYISHQYNIMIEGPRHLNSMCLAEKPLLLLNTMLSLAIAAVAAAIQTRISAVHVTSHIWTRLLQNWTLLEVWHFFYCIAIHCNVATGVVSAVHNDTRPSCAYFHAVRAASSRFVGSCSSLLLPPHG